MQTHIYATMLLTGSVLAIGQPTLADNPPTVEQLQKQMAEMQTQMDNMRHQLGDDWLTQQRADEIRSLVQDVLADADTRASLLQSGLSAGWDKHPFIASPDGEFRLQMEGQIQIRFVYNNQDAGPGDDNRWGFENRRTKLKFGGHVFNDWKYKIGGAFDRSGGHFAVEEAYIAKELDDALTMKIGQFKSPFMREELVSSSRQLTVDRSLVNERFNQDYSQGVQLTYKTDEFHLTAMISDGIRTKNEMWETEDTEFAITGRAEFLVIGSDWGQFKDFSSKPGSDQALMIGVAGHYEKAEYGTATGPEEEDTRITVDASYEDDGWNLFGAYVYQDLQVASTNPWGIVLQGGVFMDDDVELFGRYEYGDNDDTSQELSAFTVGFNKYFNKNLKLTMDVGVGINEVTGSWDKSSVGWREDSLAGDGQVVVRSQLQLLF